jgi:hypothetical protein
MVCLTVASTFCSPLTLQMYNIFFRQLMEIVAMQQIGRHFFDPSSPAYVPAHKLEIWPGFIRWIKGSGDNECCQGPYAVCLPSGHPRPAY